MDEVDKQCKTLWIGGIQGNWDEDFVLSLFMAAGNVKSVRLIRDRDTKQNAGFGFIDFDTHKEAKRVLEEMHGKVIPGTEHAFRLNWGTGGVAKKIFSAPQGPEHTVFVGDLGPEVTDLMLLTVFQARYQSVLGAKVMLDPATGISRGFAFVRFSDKREQEKSLREMSGTFVGSRPIRVNDAVSKQRGFGQTNSSRLQTDDMNNTTLFVGCVDPSVMDIDIRNHFGTMGEVIEIKRPPHKNCAFVKFKERKDAEMALKTLHGTAIGPCQIRVSWGRAANTNPHLGHDLERASMKQRIHLEQSEFQTRMLQNPQAILQMLNPFAFQQSNGQFQSQAADPRQQHSQAQVAPAAAAAEVNAPIMECESDLVVVDVLKENLEYAERRKEQFRPFKRRLVVEERPYKEYTPITK
eukprot:TRINITY_DN777833_c0_g1_i1.p1 TRINITY_DN777833_c0_g1~~TRINITY_DN777833_c0_g1_i1.p1  ORF type:complete len:423 (-),score=102.31 TRINITY_DN777833_c0_g1_i1:196-1422(-)